MVSNPACRASPPSSLLTHTKAVHSHQGGSLPWPLPGSLHPSSALALSLCPFVTCACSAWDYAGPAAVAFFSLLVLLGGCFIISL